MLRSPTSTITTHTGTEATGVSTYAYDDNGQLTQLAHSDGARVRYGYDLAGQLIEVGVTPPGQTDGAEQVTTYGYDSVGNLVEIRDPLGGRTQIEYDAVRRPVRRVFPNGTATLWQYDLRDRVVQLEHRSPDDGVLTSFTYQRGPMSEPTRVTREDGRRSEYTYDDAFRVVSERHFDAAGTLVKQFDYHYDPAGHRTAVVEDGVRRDAAYNAALQVISVSEGDIVTESIDWDADGRRTSQQRGATSWSFDYNALDQMLTASSDGDTWSYGYDAVGRRVRITAPSGNVERHLWAPGGGSDLDLLHLLAEGENTAHIVHWAGNPQLAIIDGQPLYYLEDGLGNIAAQWDGRALREIRYSAYGEILEGSVATSDAFGSSGGFGYQGQWHDPTGLVHLRARQYDPESGLFLSRDPVAGDPRQPESFHPYLFANANPLVFTDPTGLFTMVEVNINLSADNVLQTVKVQAQNEIREEVQERVYEVISNTLIGFVESAFGLQAADFAPFTESNQKLGDLFENATVGIFCATLGHLVGHLTWLEPGINQFTGAPQTDGYFCEERGEIGRGRTERGQRHPDFLLRDQPPTTGAAKSYLTGEIKLGLNSYRNAWRRSKQLGQWEAIHKYARRHGYPPHVVVLVAFRGGKKAEIDLNWLVRKIRDEEVAGVVIVVRDSIRSKGN